MKKKTINENIKQMKKMSSKMPKTINEAINFGGKPYEEDDELMDDEMENEPESHEEPKEAGMDVMQFVDDIRKKSLRGMAQLADNPDDERYQLLKKIWQICDKKPEQQTAFGNHGQQNGQMGQMNGGNEQRM